MPNEYDLVCSLGGNCSAANALKYRNLRNFSLPFDWCYIINEKPIWMLAKCFDNDTLFEIAKKENLLSLSEKEELNVHLHANTIHYKDAFSGYYFVNHFYKSIENGGYEDFNAKFKKRLRRLIDYIKMSDKILFLLSVSFEFDKDALLELQKVLKNKYPNKKIVFNVIEFNCNNNDIIDENENLCIRKYKRDLNLYDFTSTNYEWAFLDDVKISNLFGNKIPYWQKVFIKMCPVKEFRRALKKIYKI